MKGLKFGNAGGGGISPSQPIDLLQYTWSPYDPTKEMTVPTKQTTVYTTCTQRTPVIKDNIISGIIRANWSNWYDDAIVEISEDFSTWITVLTGGGAGSGNSYIFRSASLSQYNGKQLYVRIGARLGSGGSNEKFIPAQSLTIE